MIQNLFKKTIQADDLSKTLLSHFQDHHIDWMQACGARGRCTTCKVIILEGSEHLDGLTGAEENYVREGALRPGERLACQAKISGDVSVRVPEEYKLPHIHYSDSV